MKRDGISWNLGSVCISVYSHVLPIYFHLITSLTFCRNVPFADTFFKSRMKTINLESKLLHVMTDCLDAAAVFNREFEVAKA